jgi:hypothetical protein
MITVHGNTVGKQFNSVTSFFSSSKKRLKSDIVISFTCFWKLRLALFYGNIFFGGLPSIPGTRHVHLFFFTLKTTGGRGEG